MRKLIYIVSIFLIGMMYSCKKDILNTTPLGNYSDDPMGITNHHIWWQDSTWLRSYRPGNYNSADTPVPSFTKGFWDDSLSFITKDSTGKYLTALRGFSFSFNPQEETSFDTTVATPKTLWQDYGVVDNLITASRLKHYLAG